MKLILAAIIGSTLGILSVEMWAKARGEGYRSGYSQCLGEQDDDKPSGQYRIGTR